MDGLCGVVPGRAVNRWKRGLSVADGVERLPGVKDRTWESELPPGRLNVRVSGRVTLSVVPLGLPTSDGCGRDLALLSVLGEYRNVLGDPENELDRSEPALGEKLRPGLGALNDGRDGVVWKDLGGAEILGLGLDRDGAEILGLGPDLDGLLNDEGLCQLGLEPIEGPDLDGLLIEGLCQLGLEPIEGPDRLDPMDGPESLENDRCMLDDRSDLSRASARLPNVGIVWGPNRLLTIDEITTAAVIIITAARHLFLLSVNILLLLHCASAKHRATLADTDHNHPLHNSTVFKALGFSFHPAAVRTFSSTLLRPPNSVR
jgi:hypothetical protein